MKITHVQYTVRPGFADRNAANIAAVMAELRRLRPPNLRYTVFQRDDGRTFVHLFEAEDEAAEPLLFGLPAFQAFQQELKAHAPEAPPLVMRLRRVDGTA